MTTDTDAARHDPAIEQPGHPDCAEATPGQQSGESPPWRAMIAVSQLAAHPGNVRADLDLNEEFVHSIAVNGVLTALRITPPLSTSAICSAISTPTASCASAVEAPRWGVRTTFGRARRA